jgi:integrase
VVHQALRLAPMVIVQLFGPAELKEFNLEVGEWCIGAERMKLRVQHIVSLSRQAVQILRDLEPVTGTDRFVFSSPRTPKRVLSGTRCWRRYLRMGFEQGVLTFHGWRRRYSTSEAGIRTPSSASWLTRSLMECARHTTMLSFCLNAGR